MSTSPIAPIVKEIVVEAPQERAFRVFTENIDAWWPRAHHIGKADLASAMLEPHVGGRWYEKGVDGSECEWGKVLLWDPPRKVVLAWQISTQWQYDPELRTEVEVRFEVEGPRTTRVTLEHRHIERFGEGADAVRGQLDGGWGGMLQGYRGVAEQAT